MKLKEIFEKANIVTDCKARRRSNLSGNQANITAKEIESGISIEALESLNVPVKQYATQITIHGVLPDLHSKKVCGYKSIIQNGNGSIGVKYCAIDGAKKQLIRDVSRKRTIKTFYCNIDSQGMTLTAHMFDRDECLAIYHSFPDNLIIGSKQAGVDMFGDYYVIVNIGAIYSENVWPLITAVFGLTETQYNAAIAEEARLSEVAANERAQELAAKEEKLQNAKMNAPYKPLSSLPTSGNFIRLSYSRSGAPEFYHYKLTTENRRTVHEVSLNGTVMYKRPYDKIKKSIIERAFHTGLLFQA